MRAPESPANEQERLAALARYAILDTAPELAYDEIVQLAAYICGTPIALVSLVDGHRQWFKARHGLDAAETPKEVSFCGHVVEQGAPLVVEDAFADERFADNPLVVGDPKVVFYAGAPLETHDGFTLGSLCVIDHKPRMLSAEQLDMLRALSRLVIRQFEMRRTELARAEAEARAARAQRLRQRYFEVSLDMLCIANFEGYFVELNPAWSKTLGWTVEELCARSARHGQNALGLTDVMSLAGAWRLRAAAAAADVRPLFGLEARVAPLESAHWPPERLFRLRLLACNKTGWQRLVRATHLGAVRENDKQTPAPSHLTWDDLLEEPEGLLFLIGGLDGEPSAVNGAVECVFIS